MQGYDASTYGEEFADIYDDWYPQSAITDAAVERVAALAAGGPILELGVGTGRLAIPLAARSSAVTGIDASAAMLDRMAAKPGGSDVTAVLGDMGGPLPGGPYRVVFVANNTLFNLTDADAQAAAFRHVAAVLEPAGCFVVEAFVPGVPSGSTSGVELRHMTTTTVVLSVHRTDDDRQVAEGNYVEIGEHGVRLRPWSIRFASPAQLDDLANSAGLFCERRYGGWDWSVFDETSAHHVSIYRLRS